MELCGPLSRDSVASASVILRRATELHADLKRRQRALDTARSEFTRRAQEVAVVNEDQGDCWYLDIGGSPFHTTTRALRSRPAHFFSTMTSPFFPSEADATGYTFIDRDPEWFALLLGFLRDGRAPLPRERASHSRVLREARYYGIEGLTHPLDSAQHVVVCGWGREDPHTFRPYVATYDCRAGAWVRRRALLPDATAPRLASWDDSDAPPLEPITGCVFQDRLYMAIDGKVLHSEALGCLEDSKWTELKSDPRFAEERERLRIVGVLGGRIWGMCSSGLEELGVGFQSDESDDEYDGHHLWTFDTVSKAWQWRGFKWQWWYGDDPAACIREGRLIVAGVSRPRKGHQTYRRVREYDEEGSVCNPLPPLCKPRSKAAAVALDGKVLVIGGQGPRETLLRSVEEYDPATGRWRLIAPLHTARSGCAAVVVGGCVMVVGGRDAEDRGLRSVELYVPWLDEWWQMPPLPTGMACPTMAAVMPCK